MKLQLLPYLFTVAKIDDLSAADLDEPFTFASLTDNEVSLVCKSENVPMLCDVREDGWRCLRVCGTMDFTMIGILSRLTSILAAEDVPVFVISTFDTDYIFVKEEDLSRGLNALEDEGIEITE